jgi:outer membrane lipoprotein LolB
MRIQFKIIFLVGLIFLSGCASLTPLKTAQNRDVGWDDRVQSLSAIKSWNLKAAIALHTNKEADSGSLQWNQELDHYSFLLMGPLGSSSIMLTGGPDQVELITPQGKKFYAKSAEILLEQQTGWHLPVSQLAFWIRGLPAPESPAKKQFDSFHRLSVLEQAGWKIQFLRYTTVNHVDLPSKIFLNYPALSVRLVITQWQIPQPA